MEFLPQLSALAGVVVLACMSPGPDFVAVTSSALTSRKAGLGVAFGITVAVAVWATLAIAGLGLLLTQVAWLYEIIRLIGAVFLVYLGGRMLFSAWRHKGSEMRIAPRTAGRSTVLTGFLVGMTNPKTAVFFGSLFVMLLPAQAPTWLYILTVALVAAITISWLGFLAFSFSMPRVRSTYVRIRRPVDALMGAALMALGARLVASR